jgi:hypothetical protein
MAKLTKAEAARQMGMSSARDKTPVVYSIAAHAHAPVCGRVWLTCGKLDWPRYGMISPSTTCVEEPIMRSDPRCALMVGIVLMLLVVLSRRLCRSGKSTPAATKPPRATREPKPFAGLTRTPDCPLCALEAGAQPSASACPSRILVTPTNQQVQNILPHTRCPW